MNKQGKLMAETGERNKDAVYNYFKSNPFSNQKECAEFLELHPMTVNAHVKAIRAGWKPKERNNA